MINYIWGILIILSIVSSLITGQTGALSNGTLKGASDGLALVLTMLPMMVLWSGLMEIAQESGATGLLARLFSPILKRIFPDIEPESPAFKSMSLNISANLLGLGNAATPFGLATMKELQKRSTLKGTASNSMILFVVLNTASMQILPTTVAAMRFGSGSQTPFDILPCVWITSITALCVGLILAKVFAHCNDERLIING